MGTEFIRPNATSKDSIDDNLIDVGKSSNRFYTNVPVNSTGFNTYLPREAADVPNATKHWEDSELSRLKGEEPVFTNENIYMQLIPEPKLDLEHTAPPKTEFIQLSSSGHLQPNASTLNSTWETNVNSAVFADLPESLNTANSRSYPFRYQNPPKNRKYEPVNKLYLGTTNKETAASYLDNEAVVGDYSKQKKKVYFNANNPSNYPKHPMDADARHLPVQPTIVHNPNQRYNSPPKSMKDDLASNNYAANYTNRNNPRGDYGYSKPSKLEYEKVRTSLSSHLPTSHLPSSHQPMAVPDQSNESNRPREFYVKPSNTFYATDPDPPAVQYNPPNKPLHRRPPPTPPVNTNQLVQSEPVYIQDKPSVHKKPKIPIYNLDQSQDLYTVKPKQYHNNKPAYPPYEYYFKMPSNKPADYQAPKDEYYGNNRRQPLPPPPPPQTEEYAPPLPSPKPYDTNQGTQGRSISSASSNPELLKPTYLTGFTPVIAEHKYSRPVEDYPKQNYKPNKPIQQPAIYKEPTNGKYNIQLLNSGLISISPELDNQIDRDKLAHYPNQPYNRAQSTNKLEQPQFVTANEIERVHPSYENLILPENRAYVYPKNNPNNHITTNAYTATPSNEDEVMYEKYKSMIRARLPKQNLVYRPYERLSASPNYAYNVSNNENEIAPYNYPHSYHGQHNSAPPPPPLNGHPSNHEPYNNSRPNEYLSYTPNTPKEAAPIFFSKYSLPEHGPVPNKPMLEDNDPDLYNPEGAVRYSIKRYLGRNLKNRRYFKPQSKLVYPTGGNYEVIKPNRLNNGLIPAKEDNLIDRRPQANRLNMIEHNYANNYATSASNPQINKFKFQLKSLLPRMDKISTMPYGGINIEALENQKGKLQVQKIYIKDTLPPKGNPREIRELKYNPNRPATNEQLLQLEALARQRERQKENEVLYEPMVANKTKVIFTGTRSNFTNQLRQIDIPIALQEASTAYGARIQDSKSRAAFNLTTTASNPIAEQSMTNSNSTNKRMYKVKLYVKNRGSLSGNLNNGNSNGSQTEADENKFKFIRVPTSIIAETGKRLADAGDEYKSEEYRSEYRKENPAPNKLDTLDSANAIDQSKPNRKYEDSNLIELANQKQIVKVFPLGRVALGDFSLQTDASEPSRSTQSLQRQTTPHPTTRRPADRSTQSLSTALSPIPSSTSVK